MLGIQVESTPACTVCEYRQAGQTYIHNLKVSGACHAAKTKKKKGLKGRKQRQPIEEDVSNFDSQHLEDCKTFEGKFHRVTREISRTAQGGPTGEESQRGGGGGGRAPRGRERRPSDTRDETHTTRALTINVPPPTTRV